MDRADLVQRLPVAGGASASHENRHLGIEQSAQANQFYGEPWIVGPISVTIVMGGSICS